MQVASRIWCLWGIINPVKVPTTTSGLTDLLGLPSIHVGPLKLDINFISLMTAWCLSEVIRYGFFALKEAGASPYFATWLR